MRTTVDRLRTELPPAVQVGGAAAENHDLEKALAAVTPLVLGIVLGLGFLLLLVALQAPLAAALGVVTNLLAVGADLDCRGQFGPQPVDGGPQRDSPYPRLGRGTPMKPPPTITAGRAPLRSPATTRSTSETSRRTSARSTPGISGTIGRAPGPRTRTS